MTRLWHRGRCVLLAAGAVAGPLHAAEVTAPSPAAAAETQIATGTDASDRMTVPVGLNGSGPFRFVIDTGADRTAVSDRVANALALPPRGTVTLYSSTSREPIGTAELAALDIAGRRRPPFNAAVINEDTLGASGVLGVDSLADRRVVIDFRTNRMAVAAAGEDPAKPVDHTLDRDPPGTIVITAKRRMGQLILTDAYFHGHRIDVVVDTGAEISIGNLAFLALVTRRQGMLPTDEVTGVTGHTAAVRLASLDKVKLGPLTLNNAPLAFADLACFQRFDMTKRPALLLGMNVLRQFDRVAIDFKRHRVAFLLGKDDETPSLGNFVKVGPA